ncbi:hypothetical protein ILUMI_11614 [Ignelater luminosus]|uniref:ornithine carbamoyltransferase n=1 Tax=Ignelater luminosus TaxID=2038154 RepID=A0A8K0CZZ8_IGNLU|nr:hypothetical protein ILUMI_11614 [Ignelater luminosus]
MNKLTISILPLNFIRRFSLTSILRINLVERNCLQPKNLSSEEIKSVLWTAFDLKQLSGKKCTEINNIKSSRITFLMHEPCIEIQGSAHSAANFLQAHLNIVIDPAWDNEEFVNDIGSFFTTCSDIIFCQSKYQSKVEKLATGSKIPVICLKSCSFAILNTLADMMTLQAKYGYLEGLNIGWIGKPCPLINTYLCIAIRLGLNIQYCCACTSGALMSPATLPVGMEFSERKHTLLKECKDPHNALDNVHVIVIAKHQVADYTVTLDDIVERSNKNWSLLHTLPRSHFEVTQEVFEHKNSLVTNSIYYSNVVEFQVSISS